MSQVTRLGIEGFSRGLYGSFAGKAEQELGRSGVARQRSAQRQRDGLYDIEEDDENVIRMVIAKFMEVHE